MLWCPMASEFMGHQQGGPTSVFRCWLKNDEGVYPGLVTLQPHPVMYIYLGAGWFKVEDSAYELTWFESRKPRRSS